MENELDLNLLAQILEQDDALDAYKDIIENLKTGFIDENVYAGAYIDGDKIVIMLTELSVETRESVLEVTDKPFAVVFEQAKYSLSYLQEQLEETVESLSNYPITDYGFYESENKCFIRIDNTFYTQFLSEQPVPYAADNPIIIESGTYDVASSSLIGGMEEGHQTLGFCGYFGVVDAILTTGHGATEGTRTTHGSVVQRKFLDNQYGDYAIIYPDTGYTVTNKVYGESGIISISTVFDSVPQNTILYAYGKNTHFYSGKVIETNVTSVYSNFNNTRIRGNERCEPINDFPVPGDSGGPIYRPYAGAYAACGIFTTINSSNNTWTFCPFEHITPMFTPLTHE